MTLNVRGIGEEAKVNWVRRMKHLHKANFVGLQETQLIEYERIDTHGCWGDQDFNCEGVNSSGRSGGLLSIWNKDCFIKKEVLKSRHYLIIIGKWIGIEGDTILANIYGPHNLREQKELWKEFDI